MSAPTPGPWKADDVGYILGPNGEIIADCDPIEANVGYLIQEANARLIASAPELLQELKNIANAKLKDVPEDDFRGWAQSRARFTIAKVEDQE